MIPLSTVLEHEPFDAAAASASVKVQPEDAVTDAELSASEAELAAAVRDDGSLLGEPEAEAAPETPGTDETANLEDPAGTEPVPMGTLERGGTRTELAG